jgi:alanine-glyoxylate transaminase / serine-glyoxylate transaminase / serine-pyruvate transaminase
MPQNSSRIAGRHFLQIPGPTPVPDRILHAIAKPTIDHRGPDFQKLGHKVLEGIKTIFKTKGDVIIYPASGTGAWEAALTINGGNRAFCIALEKHGRQIGFANTVY